MTPLPTVRLNLRIAHKGLILVSVPLIFELLFVSVLYGLLKDAEHQIARESHARAVVSQMNVLSRLTEDAAVALSRYKSSQDARDMQEFDRLVAQGPEAFASLRVLLRENSQDLAAIADLEKTTNEVLRVLEKSKYELISGNRLAVLTYAKILFKEGFKARKTVETLVAPYREMEDAGRQAEAKSRRLIESWLGVGIAFNIAVAVLLALFFSSGITRRLRVLTDNSVRFAQAQSLAPVMTGTDEIAKLDRAFHAMADDVRRVEQLKQDFVAMVSHDLRTPLTAVQGTLTLLEDGVYGGLNDTGMQRVYAAEQSIDRLINLINDLLDIEKMQAGQLPMILGPVPLTAVLERSVESVRGFADQQNVRLEASPIELTVMADPDRLTQVLINLLSNAIKFSPPGAIVTVDAAEHGGIAEVRVKDTGSGIPEAYRSAIFERFKQVPESGDARVKGTGLGLAICKSIIDGHNGLIGVDSEVGKGSTFWFRIPSADIR